MKKGKWIWLVSILCGVFLCLAVIQVSVHADEPVFEKMVGQCGDDVFWELVDNGSGMTLSITGNGAMWDCMDLQSLQIDEIGEMPPWFDHRLEITHVVLSDGISHIGSSAFYYCENLQSIDLPESVQTIGDFAFVGCFRLETLVLPNTLQEIGARAFSSCKSLNAIDLPESLQKIKEFAFCTCVNCLN